ncbi:MAG: hypothetical protein R3C16_00045 [Hyphomonadaceae bacterium]
MTARAIPFGLFERMLAGRYLRARREHGGVALISVISVTAILLAVFVLIVTMSVMNGFRETLMSRILGVNGHVYVDTKACRARKFSGWRRWRGKRRTCCR